MLSDTLIEAAAAATTLQVGQVDGPGDGTGTRWVPGPRNCAELFAVAPPPVQVNLTYPETLGPETRTASWRT